MLSLNSNANFAIRSFTYNSISNYIEMETRTVLLLAKYVVNSPHPSLIENWYILLEFNHIALLQIDFLSASDWSIFPLEKWFLEVIIFWLSPFLFLCCALWIIFLSINFFLSSLQLKIRVRLLRKNRVLCRWQSIIWFLFHI